VGDIIHPTLSIEVKWGKQVPAAFKVANPTLVGGLYFVTPFKCRFSQMVILRGVKKKSKFLEACLKQASDYSPLKIPVVALKPRGYKGIILVSHYWDRGKLLQELRKRRVERRSTLLFG
jgi:hypothetical protein